MPYYDLNVKTLVLAKLSNSNIAAVRVCQFFCCTACNFSNICTSEFLVKKISSITVIKLFVRFPRSK